MSSTFTKIPSLEKSLGEQISKLTFVLESLCLDFFEGAILFGSCSKGEATYRSDIDVLLIFDQDKLDFGIVQETRDQIEMHFLRKNAEQVLKEPLPVEFQVVRFSVFSSVEPEMVKNLKAGTILVDKSGRIKEKVRSINEQS